MTIEILQQAQQLHGQIEQTKAQLNQMEMMINEDKENTVKTRVRGVDFELPKAVFKGEVTKKKRDLESQLTTLQNEFDAL